MEVNLNKQDDGTLIVEIGGADAYLPNLLRQELWDDDTVTFVAFDKDHPYIGTPKLIVRGKDPVKSVLDAIERLKKTFEALEEAFKNSISEKEK